jgi:hypothetical protein
MVTLSRAAKLMARRSRHYSRLSRQVKAVKGPLLFTATVGIAALVANDSRSLLQRNNTSLLLYLSFLGIITEQASLPFLRWCVTRVPRFVGSPDTPNDVFFIPRVLTLTWPFPFRSIHDP